MGLQIKVFRRCSGSIRFEVDGRPAMVVNLNTANLLDLFGDSYASCF